MDSLRRTNLEGFEQMKQEQKAYTPRKHETLLEELLDCNVPKSEREHAAVKEIEKLTELLKECKELNPCAEEPDVILAAEKYAGVYDGDSRQDVKTDVLNAFYHGAYWKRANPWHPIETAPKDRSVNIYDKGYGQQKVQWNEFYKCFTDFHGHKYLNPTHWQELPEDP